MDIDYRAFLAMFQTEAQENLATMEEALVGLEHAPEDEERLATLFRMAHTLKGNAFSLELRPIAELSHALEDLLEAFRSRTLKVTGERISVLLESVDVLRALLLESEGPSDAPAPAPLLARLNVATAKGGKRKAEPQAPTAPQAELDVTTLPLAGAPGEVRSQRVALAKLDRLLDLATEIAIDRSRLRQTLAGQGASSLDESEHLYAELHDLVMRARLVPLRPVLAHFSRLARDLAITTGKPARFVIEERGVEVDIRMAEGLRDPLTHMLRNAFDHGIEPPKLRKTRGKDATATITLVARHASGGVLIQLTDDGQGLDRGRILGRALERGLVRESDTLDDRAVYDLVFSPGLSTAEAVTELSGRGVGLDVVRRQLEALRGSVEIASKPGQGATLSLRLPLTLAIVDALAVDVAGQTYLIPMEWIEECVDLADGDASGGAGLVELGGRSLPLLPLGVLFGRPGGGPRPRVVVARHDAGRLGLVVDALLGTRQAVIKPLSARAQGLPVFSGSTILGDGNVALMLDVAALVEEATARAAAGRDLATDKRRKQ